MSWGAGLVASLLVVLPRPATWIVALASFLVRGGILLFLAPIVVTPSPVGLANILGPTITTFWLGGMSLGFATAVTAIFAAFFGWLVIGGWVAAVTERDLIELVAADDELGAGGTIPRPSGSRRRGRIWRIVLLRLAAYVPLALALGYGSLRLVQATYRELTLPSDVVTPIAWRVISTVPEAVIAIIVTWALGETLGSLGARRLVVWGQSLDQAYFGAWADMLRRPLSTDRDVRAADGRDGAGRCADRPRVRHRLGLPADRACRGRRGERGAPAPVDADVRRDLVGGPARRRPRGRLAERVVDRGAGPRTGDVRGITTWPDGGVEALGDIRQP